MTEIQIDKARRARNHSHLRATNEYVQLEAYQKYNSHIEDRGDSWINCSTEWLKARVVQELGEFNEKPSLAEAADILNFLSMILINSGNA